MSKSYTILYQGDIKTALTKHDILDFMVLNEKLAVIYVEDSFDEVKISKIPEICSWEKEEVMSSLIDITNQLSFGISASYASGVNYVNKNPYINASGKNVLIGIIDSGIDYLHPDFINNDNTTKIVSIWDQGSDKKNSPQGTIFGSEFTREDINKAIKDNDSTLTTDEIGTGTIAAGICAGRGKLNSEYLGVAVDSELVVVKLRQYEGKFKKGVIHYINTDFLAAIKYVLDISKREQKYTIINLTVGGRSSSALIATYLDTFTYLSSSGIVLVSGAGNEGNTDIHYQGFFNDHNYQDVKIQVGEQNYLRICVSSVGPDKIGGLIISPSGELSFRVDYSPDNYIYYGKFNLENTTYEMNLIYPWILSGNQELIINLDNIKPGIWTVRLYPEFIINGEYDIYLPNKNLMSKDTRFIDPNSFSTITMYGSGENVITVGTYDNKTNSIWVGSSKGPMKGIGIKPDIVAPGVDIISASINKSYTTSTGTGVSSSIVSGVLAVIMEYIGSQGSYPGKTLYTQLLKTYLMMGADKKAIYTYPNESGGYGDLNLENTIKAIANNL